MENGNDISSSLSFNSSLSNGYSAGNNEIDLVVANLELLSLSKLSSSLEKLVVFSGEYDYSDAEIVVEDIPVGVNRCILAARSHFFHELFKNKGNDTNDSNGGVEGRPRYIMSKLVPNGRVGYEAFMVVLHYLYAGRLKPAPPEVSKCVDESCAHDACGPAINFAVELMYASAKFEMKEFVMVVQRRLLNFVAKAFIEDVIPILVVAFHCQLNQLLSHSVQRVVRSNLDYPCLDKELPREIVDEIRSLRVKSNQESELDILEEDTMKRIKRIHQALDSDDVELVKLLLDESDVTLDHAYALHYATAYCNSKIVREVLGLQLADVNLRNERGYTVLHVAARRRDLSVLVALLNKGVSVSETTENGETAISICRRLTRLKDYNEAAKQGKETNKDKLCIDVLEREMRRNPLDVNMIISSMVIADNLIMKLLIFENRVALARMLFPIEAKVAMQIAHADSTTGFAGLSALKSSCGGLREVDLNEIPSEQVKRLQLRLEALHKTVETGRRFFPNCSAVLDELLEDDTLDSLLLEKGTPEEQRNKRMRYMELKDEVMKAFVKDKAESNWSGFTTASSSTSSPTIKDGGTRCKSRRK
ncbi:hypothetical protein LIER_10292 [Lithospermum erythrorhizon]|uniref:Uncharacterized protein n=1 Tax=Lithospermum erythrorhizon TaxID=34254 RepID=A0AAV3PK10_LITER